MRARLLSEKIARYAGVLQAGETPLWAAPELEDFLPGFRQPFPPPSLASFVCKGLPFREILVLLADESRQSGKDLWQELFLEQCFADLNGLYIVGGKEPEDDGFFERLYEQSGLISCFTDTLPVTDGKKTAVVDLCAARRPPLHRLASASLYLDLSSDREKRRMLAEKRPDISYISVRNYLDTALKARYNAI